MAQARRPDRAVTAAAGTGKVLGALLVGIGLAEFVFTQRIGALWLVPIGWYLLVAAQVERRQATVQAALDGVRVRDAMSAGPDVGPAWWTVEAFVERLVRPGRATVLRCGRSMASLPAWSP